MKASLLSVVFIIGINSLLLAQKVDTLDVQNKKLEIELKKKEVEMKQQELEIKKQEFELLKETRIEEKEEKKEEKIIKEKKKRTEEEIQADNKLRMGKTTIISLQPFSLVIGGLELGLEKQVKEKVAIKLIAGYFYSQDPWYYRNRKVLESGNVGNRVYTVYKDGTISAEQIRVEAQLKFYANAKQVGLNGIYFAPFLQYKQMEKVDKIISFSQEMVPPYSSSLSERTEAIVAKMATVGLAIGYQYSKTPIAVDLNFSAGLGIPVNSFNNSDFSIPVVHSFNRGGKPRIGFSVGFPF
jgi:hypothetical protein